MKNGKRFMALILVFVLMFSMVSCGTQKDEPTTEESSAVAESSDETAEGTSDAEAPESTVVAEATLPPLDPEKVTAMKPGTYTKTVTGMHAGLTVEVTLAEKEIESVVVKEHDETIGVSDVAIEELPKSIVEMQSIGIDTITGATMTSRGIFEAVKEAIEEAGGNPDDFVRIPEKLEAAVVRPIMGTVDLPTEWDKTYDVIVVGGGFAGLAAAHSAAEHGAKTVLLEKMPVVGGNSQINGGVYAAYTSKLAADLQEKLNLPPDTAEKHLEDTIVGGDYMSIPAQAANVVYGSPFYLDLLLDNGLEVRESLTRPGGHYGYRTYTTINGVGADIVQVQKKMVEESGAEVLTNHKVVEIYRDRANTNNVVGVKVELSDGSIENFKAEKGVILAAGGFSANVDMRSKHVPTLTSDIPTTNHVGATGEVISMAQEIGANTMQMSYIQLYPFANPNTGVLDAYAVIPFSGPSSGVVYVDINGERYVNEGERRDVCSKAAQDSAGFPTFCIFNENIVENGGFISETQMTEGMAADRIFKADTLEELAAEINKREYKGNAVDMQGATLAQTIDTHNGYVNNGEDPDFGKVIDKGIMLTIEEGPYYAIPQWPSVHHTMGGLTITPKTEVEDMWGNTIPNLYAAGEIAGGTHGTNRLGSNAIPDACANGYIAGQLAASGTLPDFVKEAGNAD